MPCKDATEKIRQDAENFQPYSIKIISLRLLIGPDNEQTSLDIYAKNRQRNIRIPKNFDLNFG